MSMAHVLSIKSTVAFFLTVGLVILPIWSLISCLRSSDPKWIRNLWLLFMLLFWPILFWKFIPHTDLLLLSVGSAIYGMLESRRKALQWCSAIFMILSIFFIVTRQTTMEFQQLAIMKLPYLVNEVDYSARAIPEKERHLIKIRLGMIRTELRDQKVRDREKDAAVLLVEELAEGVKQKRFAASDYQAWLKNAEIHLAKNPNFAAEERSLLGDLQPDPQP